MISLILSDTTLSGPQLWLLYVMGALTIVYAIFLRPMQKRHKDPLTRAFQPGSLARQRDVEKQMETLLVELSEMARQITAQLDTRAAKLQGLLAEADKRIAELQGHGNGEARVEAMPRISASVGSPMTQPPTPAAAGRDIPAPPESSRHRDIYVLADAGMNVAQIAQKLSRPGGEIELILALRPRKAPAE
ncbi:MAG: hypothetical protein ABSH22_00880 [Tepidisphaeraceae bacterium]|jgi:hypothetical protein